MRRVSHVLVLLRILVEPQLVECKLFLFDLHRLVVLYRGRNRSRALCTFLGRTVAALDGNHALDFVFEDVFQR